MKTVTHIIADKEGRPLKVERLQVTGDNRAQPQKSPTVPTTMPEEVALRAEETGMLILMHSGARWNSGGGGQRPQQLAEALAEHAAVVHLSGGDRNMVQRPVRQALIASTAKLGEFLATPVSPRVVRVFYSAYPDPVLRGLLDRLGPEWFVVYDCIDAWEAFRPNAWYDVTVERAAVRRADLVICTAARLCEHIAGLGIRRPPPIEFLPNSTALVGQSVWDGEPDVDCVFVGWLENGWQAFEYMYVLAEHGVTLRVIGPRPRTGLPFEHPNVEWVGLIENAKLLAWLSRARVGIIPFRRSPLVDAVWPIKYADYLAAGLPTVASHLPELEGWPWCKVTHNEAEFVAAVQEALAREWPREQIRQTALQHTREERARVLLDLIRRERGTWEA